MNYNDESYNEKIRELKKTITDLIDNSPEVRKILSELSDGAVAPFLFVELRIGFADGLKGLDTEELKKKLADIIEEKKMTWTKKDKEFLKSINIEIQEDEI